MVILTSLIDIRSIHIIFLLYCLAAHGGYLGNGGTYQTYRNYTVSCVVGIFAPILSAYLIQVPLLGRRRAMAMTGPMAGTFLAAFMSLKSEGQNLAFSSMINFW